MARSSTSGQGRPKGAKNKTTAEIKEMLLGALSDVGGRQYLAVQAIESPAAFLSLVGKLIPSEIKQELTGQDGGPLQITHITRTIVDPLDASDNTDS